MEVLLDPLEEEFHLPTLFVQLRNRQGLQVQVIGEEDQGFTRLRVVVFYAAQLFRVGLSAFFNDR